MSKEAILVTGGVGYIGSNVVLALKQKSYEVIILDNLVNGHRYIAEEVLSTKLIVGDIADRPLLDRVFAENNIWEAMQF